MTSEAMKEIMRRRSTRVLGSAAVLWTVFVGCDKADTKHAEAPAVAPRSARPTPTPAVAAAPRAKSVTPLCLKFRDDVGKAIGQPITEVSDRVLPGWPLRCIYRTATTPAMIEPAQGGDLAAARKGYQMGGHPTDSPLGKGTFRTDFGGLNQVIGMQGSTMLAVGGPAEFPELETLWRIVAAGL